MTMKNFNLKKVKIHDELSEETMCFSAELWVDGKHVADVSNRGHGGSNDFYIHKPFTYKDIDEFDTLDGEVAIFEKADEIDIVKKRQSKAFVLRNSKDGKIYHQKFPSGWTITKMKKAPNYATYLDGVKQRFVKEGMELLNTNL